MKLTILLVSRYGIKSKAQQVDTELVNIFLNSTNNKKEDLKRTMNKFNKTEYHSNPTYFKNPYKSLKKLNLNSQICDNLMKYKANEQIEHYKSYYKNALEIFPKMK